MPLVNRNTSTIKRNSFTVGYDSTVLLKIEATVYKAPLYTHTHIHQPRNVPSTICEYICAIIILKIMIFSWNTLMRMCGTAKMKIFKMIKFIIRFVEQKISRNSFNDT